MIKYSTEYFFILLQAYTHKITSQEPLKNKQPLKTGPHK